MKRTILLVALALLLLTGCGKAAEQVTPVVADPVELYEQMTKLDGMPEMFTVPGDKAYLLLGIDPEDCVVEITAICNDSLQADELWLIQAKDRDAAARIAELAKKRMDQKALELKEYLPEQYEVVQKGVVLEKGDTVILIISPFVDELTKLVG